MALKQDEYKIIVTAIDKTKAAFSDIDNSLKNMNSKFAVLKRETPVTETYELSKAFRQVGISLSGLSFVPVIGELSNMGSMVTGAAGSMKNLMAALKNLGGVSITALGPAGMAGAAGLASAGGFALGKAIDSWVYKLTNIDISGLNELKDVMKNIKEETDAMAPRLEKAIKEFADLGIMPGVTWKQSMERFNEEVKKGTILFDEVSKKWITQSEAAAKALEKLKEAAIKAMEGQKTTLTGQLNNLKAYYSSLEKLHNEYIEKAKAKTQELLDMENSIHGAKSETSNIVSSIRQKGMSSADVYNEKVKQLGEQEFQAWIMKPPEDVKQWDEKINILKKIQQEWGNLSDEVRDGENIVVSASDAQSKAMQKVKDIGNQLTWAIQDRIKVTQEEKAAHESTAASISTAMKAAQASILDVTNQLAQMDMSLAKEKKLDININQAFDNLKKVREQIDAIPDVTTKKVIIETFTKSSPAMPFSEGIEYMKEQLGSLPTGADFTVDMSSFTGMIEQYKISSSAYATLLGSVQSLPGIPHYGASSLMAGLQESMDMIKDMLNISKVQALGGVLSQLHGHGKIDSMLQDLIEGYLGDIRSFQGLTSPIEFQRPSFVKVHEGEKLYPAGGKTENIVFNSTLHINGTRIEDGRSLANQYDKEMADMIRSGRSRITKAIREKLKYYNSFQ